MHSLNVPSPSEWMAAKTPPHKTWYQFFVDLVRVVKGSQECGDETTYTIDSGTITVTHFGMVLVDTEAGGAADDLITINGGIYGKIIVVRSTNSGRDVTLKDGADNLNLAGDFTLTNTNDTITLISDGSEWFEMARSDNS